MYLIAGKNNISCYISLCIIDTCLLTILSINMTSLERVSSIRGNEKESVREYNFSHNTDGRDAATTACCMNVKGPKKQSKHTTILQQTKKRNDPNLEKLCHGGTTRHINHCMLPVGSIKGRKPSSRNQDSRRRKYSKVWKKSATHYTIYHSGTQVYIYSIQ